MPPPNSPVAAMSGRDTSPSPDIPLSPDAQSSTLLTPPPATGHSASELASLLVSSARGDAEAFATFYDATSSYVYGLSVTVVRSPVAAARLTQQIYVDVWRDPRQLLSPKVTVLAVLVALTHRRAVDVARTNGAMPPTGGRSSRLSLPRVNRLERAVLTPLQQEIVVLAYLGGYTVRQVATMLGLPSATVRAALTGALSGLQRARVAVVS